MQGPLGQFLKLYELYFSLNPHCFPHFDPEKEKITLVGMINRRVSGSRKLTSIQHADMETKCKKAKNSTDETV